MTHEKARQLLLAGEVIYGPDDEIEGDYINLSDAFYWAYADVEPIPTIEHLVAVAELYDRYGMCGVYFWVMQQRGIESVEFADVNRKVEFVRNEERIRAAIPSSTKRAYHKESYTIGQPSEGRE